MVYSSAFGKLHEVEYEKTLRNNKHIVVVYNNLMEYVIANQFKNLNGVYLVNWFDYDSDNEFIQRLDKADIVVLLMENMSNEDGTKTTHPRFHLIKDKLEDTKKIVIIDKNKNLNKVISTLI